MQLCRRRTRRPTKAEAFRILFPTGPSTAAWVRFDVLSPVARCAHHHVPQQYEGCNAHREKHELEPETFGIDELAMVVEVKPGPRKGGHIDHEDKTKVREDEASDEEDGDGDAADCSPTRLAFEVTVDARHAASSLRRLRRATCAPVKHALHQLTAVKHSSCS